MKTIVTIITLCTIFLFIACAQKNKQQMNETLQTIHNRKSVRKFADKNVSEEQIEVLLKAAMAAPSSKNNQPWKFYVIRNKQVLQQLADTLPFAKMLPQAPVVIVVCGDNTKGVNEPDQALNWALDSSAASQNILLAAQSLGLGTVWTGIFPYKKRIEAVQHVLGLPENIIPLNAIPVGYPIGNDQPKDKFKPENIMWID